jgi:hypothetical protein
VTVKVPHEREEVWAPDMPEHDDRPSPKTRPTGEIVLRDLEPIEVLGYTGDAMRHRFGSTQNGNAGHPQTKQTSAPAKGGKSGAMKGGKGC